VIRRLVFLFSGSAVFWLLVGLPARHLGGGDAAMVFLGTALLLCLAPAAATLIWGEWALRQAPDKQLILVLGGTAVRMACVLSSGWGLYLWAPFYQRQDGFLIWLLIGYLFTLALDMTLLVVGRTETQGPMS
jgi:hypothetical protein